MSLKDRMKTLFHKTIRIRGRVVKVIPLLILVLLITGGTAALVLHFVLSLDTTGNVVTNDYALQFQDMQGNTVSTIDFGDVVQAESKWTSQYNLSLINSNTEVLAAVDLIGTLTDGVSVETYDNSSGTPALWQYGEAYAKNMGNGYENFVIVVFQISADLSAPAGSIGDFTIDFEAYEDQIFQTSADVVKTGDEPSKFGIFDDDLGTTEITLLDFGALDQGQTSTLDYYLINNRDNYKMEYDWTTQSLPTGVTFVVYLDDGSGGWVEWPEGTVEDQSGDGTAEAIRFEVSLPADWDGGDVSFDWILNGVNT